MQKITIATRGSKLALWQAEYIKTALMAEYPGLSVELLIIKTKGDKILDVPLAKVGGKGLFVKEIEEALLEGRADLAVHSMKDVPTELPEGLVVAIHPKREDCTDTLLSVAYDGLAELPSGAVIGTSSLRRQAQLKLLRPDVQIKDLRGNLDTRVEKLMQGHYDAIVVATAGLKRLEITAPKMERLVPPKFLPAVAQGALGLEYREKDHNIAALLLCLHHERTGIEVQAERGFLTGLNGGCQVPIAAWAQVQGAEVSLTGFVADIDGSSPLRVKGTAPISEAWSLGTQLAKQILAAGGGEILTRVYSQNT